MHLNLSLFLSLPLMDEMEKKFSVTATVTSKMHGHWVQKNGTQVFKREEIHSKQKSHKLIAHTQTSTFILYECCSKAIVLLYI